ncbi:MAG: hypothetical protein ACOCU4_02360 [Alkalispirochaeta sp.]
MEQLWTAPYNELVDFVVSEPDISIGRDVVAIEEGIRPDFYSKFNAVRAAFLAQNYSGLLDESYALCTEFMQVKGELSARLGLRDVLMPKELDRFLTDPFQQIIRELFDPLFALLQEKIEAPEFADDVDVHVEEAFHTLYHSGFIKWFVLSLVKNLGPESVYEVPLPVPSSKQIIKHRDDIRQNVPFPRLTTVMSFEVVRRAILLVPDFIVRSADLGRYVAFRTAVGRALWRSTYYSEKREWLSIAEILDRHGVTELKPHLLVYVGEKLEDISLVADCDQFCRPDLIVYFIGLPDQADVDKDEQLREIKTAHEILKPHRGTCVITANHLSRPQASGLDPAIRVIKFGFCSQNWQSVLALLQG